ncbi:MAG: tripartite tricarboxylate transporter substrate binding protein BugD [Rhodopseudomonas sp.]|nr:tripartite tricarboxylate transporter substrate binding protein BugD [Rhodopseudomonas sp.]
MARHCVSTLLKAAAIAVAITGALAAPSHAGDYPERFVTLIAATAAGGPGDAVARTVASRMSTILGQQVVVENVAGGGGTIGASRVAHAKPDGYTMLMHQTGITIAPALYSNLPFDLEKDLKPVGMVNVTYTFLIGRKSLPANNINELVAWMKGPGKPAKFAHPGVGSMGHLATVSFAKDVGAEIAPVPYRGIGPAMGDIIGEHVDILWAGPATAVPQIKAGAVKVFAFNGNKRSPVLPDVPSTGELGYKDMDIPFWQALFVPAGTPQPIVDKLNAALRETLADPHVLKVFHDTGAEAYPADMQTTAAATTFIHEQVAHWAAVVKEHNIKLDRK